MPLFQKVAIVGVGLIGGSIGLAVKKNGLADEVVGISRSRQTISSAVRLGAIDRGAQDIGIIKGADLVILATPVSVILELAARIAGLINSVCIVTDVGSTKGQIVRRLEKIFPGYIGTHPVAGSEKKGVANAGASIFKGSLCIFTPTRRTERRSLAKLKVFWKRLGAKVIVLSPDKHDQALAFVSHLPHAVAFSLINTIPRDCFKFAASGLKDTTRIAASDNAVWGDIFLSNRRDILKAMDIFAMNLNRLRAVIAGKDRASLNQILQNAKNKRIALG